ncbi:MAG: ABC transporter substrate-binding protein [Thermoanaerobaculales bacterium]|nr:ABC transporter substrate-binding protein [Thermoanaerobaculales bacterium]
MKPVKSMATSLLTLAAVVALTACKSKPVVGVLLPMTGELSTYGESMKRGIDIALEMEQKNIPAGFLVLWADTKTDPTTGAAEMKRLAGEGAVLFVAGTTSDTARALLPVLDETDSIAVSPSAAAPSLTKDSRRFFRVFASDELEGRRAGRFLYDDQDKTSVIIYATDSAQARGIEPPFRLVFEQAMGGEVVGRVALDEDGWESESADLLAAHSPASAYIIGYGDETVAAIRHLREKGFEGPICASSAFYTSQIVEENPELFEGVFFPQPAFDVQSDAQLTQDFVNAYRQKFQDDPDIYAAHAFDAMRVAIFVAREAKSFSPVEIRKILAFGVKEFPGVTGIIQFNDYGDVHHNPIMFIVKDGHVINYERYIEEEKIKIREKIKKLLEG